MVHGAPELVSTIAVHLEGSGYTVLTAAAGAAVEVTAAERPSVVVLEDLTVLARLRDDRRTAMVPVVVLPSAVPGPEAVAEGLRAAAAVDHLADRHRAEARFRAVVEAAPDAMVIVGHDGRMLLVNQQTIRLFGYAREELIDQPIEMLVPARFRGVHPGHRDRYRSNPRVRPMGVGLELAGLRKNGTEFAVEISLSPLDTTDGAPTCASIRDVTDRKRVERAHMVAHEREREAISRLREVDRLRSDFVSTVSHELRTPLTAIKGYAEYLASMWDAMPDRQRRDMVHRIRHAGGRLDVLIEDLLDFSKLERGHLQVDPEPVQLAAVVRETMRHAEASLERHHLEVDLDDHAWVMADRKALMRIVENLLTNAAKFSPPGSTIRVRAERRGDRGLLSVVDQGVGIPQPHHDKVFDRFYRVPETAAAHPGTGIGLAIVKQFTEAQGGEVVLRSAAGRGSEFVVLLPTPARSPR